MSDKILINEDGSYSLQKSRKGKREFEIDGQIIIAKDRVSAKRKYRALNLVDYK